MLRSRPTRLDRDRNDKEETRCWSDRQRVPAMQYRNTTARHLDNRRHPFASYAHVFDAEEAESTSAPIDPLDDRDGRCVMRPPSRSSA